MNTPTLRHSIEMLLIFACCMSFSTAKAGPTTPPTSNVNVVNTPNVNVVNTPTVKDADNPATQPFQASVQGSFNNNGGRDTGYVGITTVPAGKRLVIEHASVFGQVLTGHSLIQTLIKVTLGGQEALHYLTISAQGSDGFFDNFVASEQVRFYADPGTQVFGYAFRNASAGDNDYVQFIISGYFVDVP